MNNENLILLTDSYKVSHYRQYPPNTAVIQSYFESRLGARYPKTTFFGLQYLIERHLMKPVTMMDIEEAKLVTEKHFGQPMLNEDGWRRIVQKHHGLLPLRIRAVKEGSQWPTGSVLMTVENTDPECFWLTNYLETLLVQVWYPSTVCTQSREMKKTLLRYLHRTGNPELVGFKLHDFGFRGSTSVESSAIGGAAHLVNFQGTDTLSAVMLAREYYDCEMAGFSIPAAEHSTITSWGQEGEVDAYRNMLEQYPGMVAVVSDSWDIRQAVQQHWGKTLKAQVLQHKGTVVIRPDSGNPEQMVVDVLNGLGKAFGYEKNEKGYKVLNPKVRVIQGDGIDPVSMEGVLIAMTAEGWSTDNIAFGSGGGLLQKVNRDTQRFAFKACARMDGAGMIHGVHKNPASDPSKASRSGWMNHEGLDTVYEDGELSRVQTFDEIRTLAEVTEKELNEV